MAAPPPSKQKRRQSVDLNDWLGSLSTSSDAEAASQSIGEPMLSPEQALLHESPAEFARRVAAARKAKAQADNMPASPRLEELAKP